MAVKNKNKKALSHKQQELHVKLKFVIKIDISLAPASTGSHLTKV